VDDRDNASARFMLEAHYFFTPSGKPLFGSNLLGATNTNKKLEWGWGPFVALQPGSDDIIDAIAAGLMIGFKRSDDPSDDASWNLGVGVVVDPNSQILGSGLVEDEPLPDGETEVRFREEEQVGILFLFSTKF
jgi:hypothetical protein